MNRLLALVAVLLLAGCVEPKGGTHGHLVVTPSLDARPTATTIREGPGELVGQVLDDEFRPLADALVEVFRRKTDLVLQLHLRTSADGAFAARGLAHGEYVVYVSRLGFQPQPPKLVLIEDGKSTTHQWLLEPMALREPFHKTETFRFQVNLYACTRIAGADGLGLCDGSGPLRSIGTRTYPLDERNQTEVQTIVVESKWRPTLGSCEGGLRTSLFSPDQDADRLMTDRRPDNPYHWDNADDLRTPTALRLNRTGGDAQALGSSNRVAMNAARNLTTHGPWHVVASAHHAPVLAGTDFSCMLLQSIDVWTTFFHGEPAPPRWSYLGP